MSAETTNGIAGTNAAVALTLLLLCCLCYCSAQHEERAKSEHDHVRTKSSSAWAPRAQLVTNGMPPLTPGVAEPATTDGDGDDEAVSSGVPGATNDDGGTMLHDYLFRRPSNMFRGLLRTGVNVVQRSMDTFQGVSSKMFEIARHRTRRAKSNATESASRSVVPKAADSAEPANDEPRAGGGRPRSGRFPTDFGGSVFNMIDTGIAGMEQVTDLGLLLGNIGTHKIRAGLNGNNGNQEIFKLLVKYIGSRVGMNTKGSPTQIIDDVGTISTFMATDDQVTHAISLVMERLMTNPKVSSALVRMIISILDSSPSTSCLLDRLPLSPSDIRMAFEVFVGSNGQIMMKTIAGLLSELTTGPDTRAFLESVMGMMSIFKSNGPASSNSTQPEKPKSLFGSVTSFFMGSDDSNEDKTLEKTAVSSSISSSVPLSVSARRKKIRDRVKKPIAPVEEDSWFTDNDDDNEIKTFRAPTTRPLKRDQESRSRKANRPDKSENDRVPSRSNKRNGNSIFDSNSNSDDRKKSRSKSHRKMTGDDGHNGGRSKMQSSKTMKNGQSSGAISGDDDDW